VSIPGVYDLTLPVLRELSDGGVHTTGQLTASLAADLSLTQTELARKRRDGRPLFQNRIEWARTHLKKAGLLEYPEPRASKITAKGLQLLACDPRQLGPDFLRSGASPQPPPATAGIAPSGGSLEAELRALSGSAVECDPDWEIVRRLNGWGPYPPMSYQKVAKDTGRTTQNILALGRACRRQPPKEAPMLDAALRLTLERPDQDSEELAVNLVRFGITEDAFCIAGLCEAARRFGRQEEWGALVRQLAASRTGRTVRPRPFDSWFEVDVFLYISGLGHRVIPQQRIGNYRVDLLLPDFVPQLVVECDGDKYHGRERAKADEDREADLLKRGYHLLRFRYSDYVAKPHSIKSGLAEILSRPESVGLQLRAG